MFLDKLPKKEKFGLFIAVVFVSVAALDRLVVDPITTRVQWINHQIEIAEKELERNLRNINQKEVIAEKYQKYVKYVKKVGSDEEEVAKLLGEIEELARGSTVYLVDMKPRTSKEIDFYKEYTVEVEAEGNVRSVVRFLYQLNNSTQLLRTEKLRLTLKEKDSSVIKATILITKILFP